MCVNCVLSFSAGVVRKCDIFTDASGKSKVHHMQHAYNLYGNHTHFFFFHVCVLMAVPTVY